MVSKDDGKGKLEIITVKTSIGKALRKHSSGTNKQTKNSQIP